MLASLKHPYLSCSASWPFCTSWTQRWWDKVLCPWVVSLRCAVSGSPDPIYNHRFCFSWCRLPIRSTGPLHSLLQRHTGPGICREKQSQVELKGQATVKVVCTSTGSYNLIVCGPSGTARFLIKPLQSHKSFIWIV